MRVILEMKEIEQAISDYLMKQGLNPEGRGFTLFLKKDGSINHEVDRAEIYLEAK